MRFLIGCATGATLLAGASVAQTEAEQAPVLAAQYDEAISDDETVLTRAIAQFFSDRSCVFNVADFWSGAEIGLAMLDNLGVITGLDPLPDPARIEFASPNDEDAYTREYDDIFAVMDVASENLFATGAIVEGPEAGVYTMVEGCP